MSQFKYLEHWGIEIYHIITRSIYSNKYCMNKSMMPLSWCPEIRPISYKTDYLQPLNRLTSVFLSDLTVLQIYSWIQPHCNVWHFMQAAWPWQDGHCLYPARPMITFCPQCRSITPLHEVQAYHITCLITKITCLFVDLMSSCWRSYIFHWEVTSIVYHIIRTKQNHDQLNLPQTPLEIHWHGC